MDEAVEGYGGHDVDEETGWVLVGRLMAFGARGKGGVYLVTLSREWNTIEFLHMAMATALLP